MTHRIAMALPRCASLNNHPALKSWKQKVESAKTSATKNLGGSFHRVSLFLGNILCKNYQDKEVEQ